MSLKGIAVVPIPPQLKGLCYYLCVSRGHLPECLEEPDTVDLSLELVLKRWEWDTSFLAVDSMEIIFLFFKNTPLF